MDYDRLRWCVNEIADSPPQQHPDFGITVLPSASTAGTRPAAKNAVRSSPSAAGARTDFQQSTALRKRGGRVPAGGSPGTRVALPCAGDAGPSSSMRAAFSPRLATATPLWPLTHRISDGAILFIITPGARVSMPQGSARPRTDSASTATTIPAITSVPESTVWRPMFTATRRTSSARSPNAGRRCSSATWDRRFCTVQRAATSSFWARQAAP